MNTSDQLLTKHSTKALWSECPNHLRGSFSSVLTLLYLLLVWLWATQTGVKELGSRQDHRSWSSGRYDLLQAMFLIMSNLIPLNHNPSELAVATVEGPSAICYTRHTCLAIFSAWCALYIGGAGTEHWYFITIFKLCFCKIKKTKQKLWALGIPADTAFLSQSDKESQDSKRCSPIAEKIIYTFDDLPTETN